MYSGGRKRGATKSPTVQVGPPNGNNATSLRTTPRPGHSPQSPQPHSTPNKHAAEPKQPTRTATTTPGQEQTNQNTGSKTSHPQDQPTPPEKNRNPQTPTNQQTPPPNRGTTRTKTHSPPSRWEGELRRGLRGDAPHTPHHPPTRNQNPPNKHPHPPDTPTPEPNPNQKTRPQNQNPHHPPTTPPPTPHQVPCIHAMDHIQPPSTLANKLEQNQETSSRKSKTQMPRPGPSRHPTTLQ